MGLKVQRRAGFGAQVLWVFKGLGFKNSRFGRC